MECGDWVLPRISISSWITENNGIFMKIISHRGNLNGPDKEVENSPTQVDICISKGFDVEIDLWYDESEKSLLLGHDLGEYKVDLEWLIKRRESLWIHCKNSDALFLLSSGENDLHFFWHDKDDYTITNKGLIWAYPGMKLSELSVHVLPEWQNDNLDSFEYGRCFGICTDYPEILRSR